METILIPGLQDVLATLAAAIALGILVRRTVRMFGTKDESPGCDGCPSCPKPVGPKDPHAAAPVILLKRSSASAPGVRR